MIVEPTTRTAPPHRPVGTSRRAPAGWNEPTRPLPHLTPQPRDWLPYAALGGTTVLIGCLATIVVVLAR